ncbi:YlbF family regulator [Roseibacillus ishigakijimensis]|uniref:YlbF family regulator n=1 Tax=Roseibacillus ishigakijimensis TaxID=454146 RepID=A0A934RNX0_9BACT|nr:YlbF family regulator [Roseibacillus ishigakijimensis]MBK1832856.1 YlbF family regulator [Roseibacillus ishigakijimensis]
MSILEDNSPVMEKTRELCALIAENDEFASLQKDVETFFADDTARDSFRRVQEWGDELHQKQQAGLELSDSEIKDFESARGALFENPVATNFLNAQQTLQALQGSVSKYVGMTLELGRVPSAEDFAAQDGGGCCGGGGGGGCGCG